MRFLCAIHAVFAPLLTATTTGHGDPPFRFATVQAMRMAGAAVLSVDAGKTLMLDGEAVLASANEAKIAIVGRRLPQ